jgi:hypothetical protein
MNESPHIRIEECTCDRSSNNNDMKKDNLKARTNDLGQQSFDDAIASNEKVISKSSFELPRHPTLLLKVLEFILSSYHHRF